MQAPALESVCFIVFGPPQPKQRARRGARGRWYTPAETRRYEAAVRAIASVNLAHWRRDGTYRLRVSAFFGDRRRRDLDNVVKAVGDALNGVGYEDDSQVVETRTSKHVAPGDPRTIVMLERIGDAPARKARRA